MIFQAVVHEVMPQREYKMKNGSVDNSREIRVIDMTPGATVSGSVLALIVKGVDMERASKLVTMDKIEVHASGVRFFNNAVQFSGTFKQEKKV